MTSAVLLSTIIFLPLVVALVVLALPRSAEAWAARLGVGTLAACAALVLAMPVTGAGGFGFLPGTGELQAIVSVPWIPSFQVEYFLGLDGWNFPLLVMTSLITLLAGVASWKVERHPRVYWALFLILTTGMFGVFLALDLLLFYIFFEIVLLPMYFLVGLWGGARKEYAAIKFFLYTLLGSILILVGILLMYFASDLTQLSPAQLNAAAVPQRVIDQVAAAEPGTAVHTFNLIALRQLAIETSVFEAESLGGQSVQWWAFLLFLVGFLIKVPAVPLHTWLPDAHVEAPTPISMLLAGVLLKLGGYGLVRIAYPLCPSAAQELALLVGILGAVSIVYGAFAALAQTDFKRLVAYSSVSHMGYVVLGIAAWSSAADAQYWSMGLNGAMFQMIAHGVTSAGLFFIVGVIYERAGHRDLNRLGGVFAKMPFYSGTAFLLTFAALGLPGLCGFIGEVFVLLSAWKFNPVLASLGAFTLIITAAYFLWALQRVFLGPPAEGATADRLVDLNIREKLVAVPLMVAAVGLGVFPDLVFRYTEPTISQTAKALVNRADDEIAPPAVARVEQPQEAGR